LKIYEKFTVNVNSADLRTFIKSGIAPTSLISDILSEIRREYEKRRREEFVEISMRWAQ